MENDHLAPLKELLARLWQAHGRETPIDGLFLTSVTVPTGPIHAVYRPSLCVVVQGAKTSMLGDRAYSYDTGKCLIASMEVPIRAEITRATPDQPYLAFSLALDPATISDLLLELELDGTVDAPAGAALAVHAFGPELADPLCRLLALCERPRDITILAPLIRREITWLLLNGPMGPALRQIGLAGSHMARIGRALACIRTSFADQLNVRQLADVAGMSPATFHRHFKAVTAMTPVQYQKQLRLQEARRLLLSDNADVARIGYAIGYESPSQFSREYRRLFGSPPGRDGQQIRRVLTPQVDV
ncbi:AraC family transcriptional regulator [Paracoccus litorisediminis]|uniref:Helix-turn-helix domain-containing protein n=1 Tax=Paracoccus litorisediminis TaxID=2006130 RepID=A0A844HNU6_9RHOB|nr:AraC family transcriptional regulator [Paracoccus litorisediminis]MTH60027.1 helix-turn-helix domain-containing protein [Paracoccus litorisediminis]